MKIGTWADRVVSINLQMAWSFQKHILCPRPPKLYQDIGRSVAVPFNKVQRATKVYSLLWDSAICKPNFLLLVHLIEPKVATPGTTTMARARQQRSIPKKLTQEWSLCQLAAVVDVFTLGQKTL